MENTNEFWDDLLPLIEEGRVIPVVGRDLLTMPDGEGTTQLYPYLAKRLALKLGVPDNDLPNGDELNEVACRYIARGKLWQEIYSRLKVVGDEAIPALSIPKPLLQLASIKSFELFVSTTFDSLLTRAINQVRHGGRPNTKVLAYSPEIRQDIPDYFNSPIVYHLLGKLSATPVYAVTQEDTVEFFHGLQSEAKRPPLLFDQLRAQSLLILGSRFGDWVTRFFIRTSQRKRLSEGTRINYIAEGGQPDPNLVLFLHNFSRGTKIYAGAGAVEFVDELYQRWSERAAASTEQIAHAEKNQNDDAGAVFLSYASEDRAAAAKIKMGLESAGIDVFFDKNADALQGGESWDPKLRRKVSEASIFVPVISRHTLSSERRYFRVEWHEALDEVRYRPLSDEHVYLLPVLIDDTPDNDPNVPARFWEAQCSRLPGGEPTPEFVGRVQQIYRQYQKRRLAAI